MTTEPVVIRPAQAASGDTPIGFAYGVGAFFLWGLMPLYLKVVEHIGPAEIVAHRAIWSVPIAGAVLLLLGRTADLKAAFRSPRTLAMAVVTAFLISINWGVYVWAITADRALEAALGYYINPLVNVLMGAVLLGERPNRLQMGAVGLAALAVALLTVRQGSLPWISLVLAISFGIYGFLRKTLPIGPSQGFFLEALVLSVPALGYVVWLAAEGGDHFLGGSPADPFLLMLAGPVTAFPLLLYAFGAKLLRYTTIGLLQYIAPTMIFLSAIFVFQEPFDAVKGIAFALIWTALAIYSWSMVGESRRSVTTDL
ncbi:MAG: EamA family transporter RarD [Rhizobiaceae bacterium]